MSQSIDPATLELVQQALIENGLDCGTEPQSNTFGALTVAAVRAFQAKHHDAAGHPLVVDGLVGPNTLWALEHPSDDPPASPLAKTGSQLVALAALDSAISELELGVKEDPMGSNRGPRVDVYTFHQKVDPSLPGPSWCAYFVSYNFRVGGQGKSPFATIAGAQSLLAWGVHMGLAADPAKGAQPGDIFVIKNGPVHGHCGHVYDVAGSNVVTLEGNSANRVRSITRPLSTINGLVRIPG